MVGATLLSFIMQHVCHRRHTNEGAKMRPGTPARVAHLGTAQASGGRGDPVALGVAANGRRLSGPISGIDS